MTVTKGTDVKPILLDLFCGAGGAAMGYKRAGFHVVGVDIEPQPHYAGDEFVQADALQYLRNTLNRGAMPYDVIHASPPCQGYSVTRYTHAGRDYPMLVEPVRGWLQAARVPYVIENVVGAPLLDPLLLCGAWFGLTATDHDGDRLFLRRHRLFEGNVLLMSGEPCGCRRMRALGYMVGGVYGGGSQNRRKAAWRGGTSRRGGYTPSASVMRQLMGVDWTTARELTQMIPPAYTEYIGAQLLAQLGVAA